MTGPSGLCIAQHLVNCSRVGSYEIGLVGKDLEESRSGRVGSLFEFRLAHVEFIFQVDIPVDRTPDIGPLSFMGCLKKKVEAHGA